MSEKAYCPRGDMEGIYISSVELHDLSEKIGSKYLDEVVPLPDKTPDEQKELIKNCGKDHDDLDNAQYWEVDTGSHGWCCSKCGTVIQWG